MDGRPAPVLMLAVALGTGLVVCCADAGRAPESATLGIASFPLSGERSVPLNRSLTVHFTEDLDPSSVTLASARVLDPDGRAARGHLSVLGATLTFTPSLPLLADLSDGGLRPDTSYRFALLGFPSPDGLRSRTSLPLSRTLSLGFRTGPVEEPEVRTPFEDASPRRALPLQLLTERIGPHDGVRLACGEGIHPATLRADDFVLQQGGGERIPLRASLVENELHGAVIELVPVAAPGGPRRSLRTGSYGLWADPLELSLRDLGGNPILHAWPYPVEIEVGPYGAEDEQQTRDPLRVPTAWWGASGDAVTGYFEDFLTTDMRSPLAVAGAEGTASWEGNGVVTVRVPSAAGDGRDGRVELEGVESRADVAASRLRLGADRTCRIEAGRGLVVLRSQGSIRIDGDLLRTDVELQPVYARGADETFGEWDARLERIERARRRLLAVRVCPFPLLGWSVAPPRVRLPTRLTSIPPMRAESTIGRYPAAMRQPTALTDWIAAARDAGAGWTVLVAGGDLVIDGSVRVDTPLLLVAGGWIRVSGRVEAREICRLGHGGGSGLSSVEPDQKPDFLALDPPRTNPLVEPTTWSVVSKAWRPPDGVDHWLPARVTGSRGGRYRVSYLGERDGVAFDVEVVGPVDDPSKLEGCQAVRVRIDFDLPARSSSLAPWDPPVVDSVELDWIPAASGGSR